MKRIIYLALLIFMIASVSGIGPKPIIFVPYSSPGQIFNCTSEIIANISSGDSLVAYYNSSNLAISNMTRIDCINVTDGLNVTFIPQNPLLQGNYLFSTFAKNELGDPGNPTSIGFTVTPFDLSTVRLIEPTCSSGTPENCFLDSDSFTKIRLNTTPWDANCKYSTNEADPYGAMSGFDETGGLLHKETGSFSILPAQGYLKFFTNCTEIYFNSSVLKNFTFYNDLTITLEEPDCDNPSYCNQTAPSITVKVKTNIESDCYYNYTLKETNDPVFSDMKLMTPSGGNINHSVSSVPVPDDNFTAFYVTCKDKSGLGINSSEEFIFHGPSMPLDPDESQTKCGTFASKDSTQVICDIEREINCWDPDVASSPPNHKSCCGDDSLYQDCWLDDNNRGCCEINIGQSTEPAYVTDVDISQKLCNMLGIKINGGSSAASCDTNNKNYCWAGGVTVSADQHKSCCGDDTDENWEYTTNTDLADILVNQTCYYEYWKKRDSVSLTYYSISIN